MVLVPVYGLCLFFFFFAQNRLFLKKEKRKKERKKGKRKEKKKKRGVPARVCTLLFIPKPFVLPYCLGTRFGSALFFPIHSSSVHSYLFALTVLFCIHHPLHVDLHMALLGPHKLHSSWVVLRTAKRLHTHGRMPRSA